MATGAGTTSEPVDAPQAPAAPSRVAFLDNLRYLMVVLVVLFHAVAAYAVVAPHWPIHDTTTLAADVIRELLDVFLMPVLFFAAGYFALHSLRKRGTWRFLKEKVERLLVPWAIAVFVVLPLVLYDQPVKPIRPFWRYWLSYLGSFQFQLRPTQTPVGETTQAVYWFISLLFAFFVVLVLFDVLKRRLRGNAGASIERVPASGRSVLTGLVVFGLLTSAAYFALLLLVPESSWFTVYMFLEFQVTHLVPFAGCFALGVYAESRGWFAGGRQLGRPAVWGGLALVLGSAYLWFGQPMFANTAGAADPSVGYLLGFAVLRSFLLVSVLVVLCSFGVRHWNRASGLDRRLAAASYDIYLVHFLIVVALQGALLHWAGGPVAAKIAIAFVAALSVSYALSRWVLARHARAFAIVLLALFALCLVVRP
jgi:glucans biosynthesis protein C